MSALYRLKKLIFSFTSSDPSSSLTKSVAENNNKYNGDEDMLSVKTELRFVDEKNDNAYVWQQLSEHTIF